MEVLRDQLDTLRSERDGNIKTHEATLKAYEESSKKEIDDLKKEISDKDHMLEDWQVQHHKDEEIIKGLKAELASFMDERKFVDSDILGESQFFHA